LTIKNQTSAFIDLSRWVAAMLVLIMHLRGVYFVDYSELSSRSLINKIFYFITGFGSQAVVIFFVISGYLVGGKTYEQIKSKNFSPGNYFISRFSRIYIVLFPALVIGSALDWFGINYLNQNGIYSYAFGNSDLMQPADARLNTGVFLINLASLQTIAGPVLGSNRALWSLANEWWYYILFPIMASALHYKSKKYLIISSIVILFFLPFKISLYFLIWLMGFLVSIIKYKFNIYILGIILGISLFLSRSIVSNNLIFFIIALFYSLILASMNEYKFNKNLLCIYRKNFIVQSIFNFLFLSNKKLADFSFSLYAIHFPIIFILFAVLDKINLFYQCQPNLASYLIYFVLIVFIYITSYLFYLAFESKTLKLKIFLLKSLKKNNNFGL
jgi:peptidoglycan/LPS O-acetylase OafA/YrhL